MTYGPSQAYYLQLGPACRYGHIKGCYGISFRGRPHGSCLIDLGIDLMGSSQWIAWVWTDYGGYSSCLDWSTVSMVVTSRSREIELHCSCQHPMHCQFLLVTYIFFICLVLGLPPPSAILLMISSVMSRSC